MYGPAREAARHFLNVALRVAAFHTQGMQFQQFAGIILIGVFTAVFAVVLIVVQIAEHGRAMRRRDEHFPKRAQNVRTNDMFCIRREQRASVALQRVDVEMVCPEVGQNFAQLMAAVHGA